MKSAVISELAGGLGNQIFQYAFGLATAQRTGADLYLDHRFLEKRDHAGDITLRDYELDVFHVEYKKLADFAAADRLKNSFKSRIFKKALPQFSNYVHEDTKRYHAAYQNLRAPVFVSGYWQNPRYFNEFEVLLRGHLKFKPAWSADAHEYKKLIGDVKTSVSMHIRRGDYLKHQNLQGICSDAYYQKSLERIAKHSANFTVFVFSDDPAWVRNNLKLPYPMIVVEPHSKDYKNYEDLRLMAECSHHIIANSSFSWWGAWLGKKPGQIVCAPPEWDRRRKSQDIIENHWTLIHS